jgi:hypothetical protein
MARCTSISIRTWPLNVASRGSIATCQSYETGFAASPRRNPGSCARAPRPTINTIAAIQARFVDRSIAPPSRRAKEYRAQRQNVLSSVLPSSRPSFAWNTSHAEGTLGSNEREPGWELSVPSEITATAAMAMPAEAMRTALCVMAVLLVS